MSHLANEVTHLTRLINLCLAVTNKPDSELQIEIETVENVISLVIFLRQKNTKVTYRIQTESVNSTSIMEVNSYLESILANKETQS